MTRTVARRRVLKALAAVGCRGKRNDHDIAHVNLATPKNRERFCRAIAGDQWHLLASKVISLLFSGTYPVTSRTKFIWTIGDLVEAVRAAYLL